MIEFTPWPDDLAQRYRARGYWIDRPLTRILDEAIAAMAVGGVVCSMTLGRMKKRKLALKDQIARLQDEITPDIIA